MAVVFLCSAMRGWVPQGCHRLPRPTPFLGDLVLTQACLQPGSLLNPNVLHMHSPLIPSDVIVAPQISSCRDLSSPTPKSGSLLLPCALSCSGHQPESLADITDLSFPTSIHKSQILSILPVFPPATLVMQNHHPLPQVTKGFQAALPRSTRVPSKLTVTTSDLLKTSGHLSQTYCFPRSPPLSLPWPSKTCVLACSVLLQPPPGCPFVSWDAARPFAHPTHIGSTYTYPTLVCARK